MAKKALKNIQERCAGLFKGIAHNSILVYQNYDSAMNNINRIMEVENELAAVSSYAFVYAFRPIAKSLAVSTTEAYTEHYIRLAKEAITMLARGEEPRDVLCHFELRRETRHGEKI